MRNDSADDIPTLMRRAAATAVPVVRGIKDDQFERATPCADYDVRRLLNHLFQVVVNFQALARRESVDWSADPDHLTGDWRGRFVAEAERAVEAWCHPGALDGESPGMGLPRTSIAQMLMLDFLVHGWDLARATGQPYQADPDVVGLLLPTFSDMAPLARKTGAFGEPVEVAPDAPAFHRLLGVTGRDPDWRG